jgi:malate dehydrogenase (oxaloacetate-decarboxylating)(NADP+)
MIYASAEALSTALLPNEIEQNWLYPAIERIRDVSVIVTRGVIRSAQAEKVDRELALRNISDDELDEYIRARMYDPFKEHDRITNEINALIKGIGAVEPQAEVGGARELKAKPNTAEGESQFF